MAEQLNLAAPSGAQTSLWRVSEIQLTRGLAYSSDPITPDPAHSRIFIALVGTNGRTMNHVYNGQTADTLILALNKANLTTVSLERRILNQLVADGVIAGTITGTPD